MFFTLNKFLRIMIKSKSSLRCNGLFLAITASLALGCLSVAAQEAALDQLSPAEFAALERVTEPSVMGTISFLASDELAGRGTPSKEFTIATAYVASRLRASGAKGLGPEGSYYLESTIDTKRIPSTGTAFQIINETTPTFTLLNATDSPFQFEGKLPPVTRETGLPDGQGGPAVLVWEDAGDPNGNVLSLVRRRANVLAQQNVTALVIVAPQSHALWDAAMKRQSESRLVDARSQIDIPVLLVAEQTWKADVMCKLSVPASLTEKAIVRNVAAVIEGSDPELNKEAVFYSAHLDHLGEGGTGEDRIFNGADDDASGVTAVLTLADAFGALEPRTKRSTVFFTFWVRARNARIEAVGRKQPMAARKTCRGHQYRNGWSSRRSGSQQSWMTGWTESNLGPLVAAASRRVGVETFEHPTLSARLYGSSDNISFNKKGVIAHSFSAGSLHKDYHQPTDEWQRLEIPHMTQVIRGLFAGTLPIAQGQVTPERSKK